MKKEAYFKLMGLNKFAADEEQKEDRQHTSSVNALAALLSGAGVGTSLLKGTQTKVVGGALTGTGLGGAAAYHLARLLKASRTTRLLAAITGGAVGGVVGGWAGSELDSGSGPLEVKLTNYSLPVSADVHTSGNFDVRIPNTVYTKDID